MSNLISARLFVKNCNLLQEAGSVRLHQRLGIEVKTQGFVGPLSALDRGYPKCIEFATSFGLARTVIKHQLNDKTWKSKVKNLQKRRQVKVNLFGF